MGVYTRFKRGPEGFRALVELLESTPPGRRQKMIDAGMMEDPEFTDKALLAMFTFEDIKILPDVEMAELVAAAPPRVIAIAIHAESEETKTRFIRNAKAPIGAEIRDFSATSYGPSETVGAQLRLVTTARKLEQQGKIKSKRLLPK